MTRRTPEQIRFDRSRIVGYVRDQAATETWTRMPGWAKAQDVAALVKAGTLDKKVKQEFDKARGPYVVNMFGGAAVVQRLRAYYKLPEVTA